MLLKFEFETLRSLQKYSFNFWHIYVQNNIYRFKFILKKLFEKTLFFEYILYIRVLLIRLFEYGLDSIFIAVTIYAFYFKNYAQKTYVKKTIQKTLKTCNNLKMFTAIWL